LLLILNKKLDLNQETRFTIIILRCSTKLGVVSTLQL
jgi:hypothetical protein